MTTIYRAQWLCAEPSARLSDGALAVTDTKITAVGLASAVQSQFPTAQVVDLGAAVLLPGFVNCHTHLELTLMRGFLEAEESDFFAWLGKLTAARNTRLTPEDLYVSAVCGLIEAARAGITCVGDASAEGHTTLRALREVGLRGVVFYESFGPDPAQAQENFRQLGERLASLREYETPLARLGISPHAPYTVSAPQLEFITDYALAHQTPLMMHAAESAAEDELLRYGRGPFAARLQQRGIVWHAPRLSPVAYLEKLGVLRAKPLLAHCIRTDDNDLAILAAHDTAIAHCPKSNAKLYHGRARYAAFRAHGLRVGLGSDSVASNNLCDMLEEARFAVLLARTGNDVVTAPEMLGTATLGGAQALRLEQDIGCLRVGAEADFCAVTLAAAHQLPVNNPFAALMMASSGRDVRLTVVAGREIYRDGQMLTLDENYWRTRLRESAAKLW